MAYCKQTRISQLFTVLNFKTFLWNMEMLFSLFGSGGSQRQEKVSSCYRGRHWSHLPETSLQCLLTGRLWLFSSPDSDYVLHWKKILYSAGWTKTFPYISPLLSLMMYVTMVHWGHSLHEPGLQTEVLFKQNNNSFWILKSKQNVGDIYFLYPDHLM